MTTVTGVDVGAVRVHENITVGRVTENPDALHDTPRSCFAITRELIDCPTLRRCTVSLEDLLSVVLAPCPYHDRRGRGQA